MPAMTVKYPDVTVKLIGTDGNAFAVMTKVRRGIVAKHGSRAGNKWFDQAMDLGSYDQLLQFVIQTVNVE